jgi:hypothetical protein
MFKYFTTLLALLLTSHLSFADHSWGNYHWARTTSSFDLIVVNSTTSDWDSHVSIAVSDWSLSTKLNMIEDINGSTSKKVRRRCRATSGQLRICNLNYGDTGWLGIAGISLDTQGHIVNGYTKLNDSYFSLPHYNNASWKQSVTCQELGHNVGLGHQDEDFDNTALGTCMDYQDPPTDFPDTHDYEQLDAIYGHTDDYDSYDTGTDDTGGDGGTCNAPPGKGCNKTGANNDVGWGISIGRRGNAETFIRVDKNGIRHLTHVTWAVGH